MTDTLDAGVELIGATPSRGFCSGTRNMTCILGTLADGASATIALSVRAIPRGAPIHNGASVSAPEDTNAGNNNASAPAIAALSDAPMLSEWALIALALGLAMVALKRVL